MLQMKRTCEQSPSGQLLQGIQEFNRREWHECHETVEDLWIGSEGEVRTFIRGSSRLPLRCITGETETMGVLSAC
jgi:hypothetical protein